MAANEIRLMEASCRLAARTLIHVSKFVKAGVTTNELNKIADDYALTNDAVSAPLNYHGYPKSICTSINHCICHGVPDDQALKDGDIINVDVTVLKSGYFGDTSAMFMVGNVSEKAKAICAAALEAREVGIEVVGPKATMGDIGFAINKFVTKKGYWVVKEIGGHGIGKVFHDEPWVPSYGKKGKGTQLKPWVCITIEPMINETGVAIKEISIPNTSIKYYETGDKTLSAQYEHTILVTDVGHQILTLDN